MDPDQPLTSSSRSTAPAAPQPVARLRVQVGVFTGARTVLNTAHRMLYPFLPVFARGVGVDLTAMALAETARSALGLVSPLFGSLADARGRRASMVVGLLVLAAGMLLVTVWPTYPALFIAILSTMVAKLFYDPSMQATIGDRVHYTRRGRVLAITELSWSSAFLLGMPLIGWLIARTDSWRAPFPFLSVLALLSAVILWRVLPDDRLPVAQRLTLTRGFRIVLAHPAALAGLAVSGLISLSNQTIVVVYGAWMEDAFGLQVAALGLASAVIGVAELGGETLVGGFVDRLGKRRAVLLGTAANAGMAILLPVLGVGVGGALVGLFLFFLTFEFALVSQIPLMTGLVPDARATLMAGNVASMGAGRMVGALIAPFLFDIGLLANGLSAAVFDGVAVVILLLFVRQDAQA